MNNWIISQLRITIEANQQYRVSLSGAWGSIYTDQYPSLEAALVALKDPFLHLMVTRVLDGTADRFLQPFPEEQEEI